MAKWTIFDKHGVAKVSVVELELRDEWMAECYLTVTIKSATPIKFAIGDYIDYRGERYTIQYDPNVLKKASSGSYGEGFTYSNIKFVGLQDEIVRCDFNDIVLRDNQMHYTALPTFPFYCETVDDLLDRIQANLEELYPAQWTIIGLNTLRNKQRGTAVNRLKAFTDAYKTYIDQTEATKTEPYGKVGVAETVDKITCWDALKKVHDDFGLNFIIRGRVIIVGTAGVFTASKFRYGKGNGLYEIERIAESDQQIVTRLRAYGSEDNLPSRYYANTTEDMPNNMAVSKLMLPGFPTQSLADWVDAHKNAAGYEWLLDAVNEGFAFSKDAHRPYIDSPNIKEYGIRPSSIIFDGSEDKENIHPTIEGMVYDGKAIDEIYAADQIEDNGVSTENPNNFKITLPALGFDLGKVYEDGASIDIKNGMCGARSFKMVSAPTKNSDGRWVCTVERVHDDVLDLWFPYNDFQIKQGDKFVLTGIKLPDEYISSASVKLFKASIEALRKNHAPRYTYQPRIDEIWMQRQHDLAVSSDGTTSLHDTLKAGDIFSFADDDLAIDANIIIDVLTIKENGNNGVPTYEVTLRDEKQVGTMQKITNKIDSAFTNAVTTAVGGGLTSRQVQRLIERFGSEQFLSKLDDDTAAGFIKMLKGLQIGNSYVPGLLGEGGVLRMDADGKTYLEADKMYIRMKAYFDSVEVREYKHSVGNRVASPAGSKCVRVEWHGANNKVLEPTDANLKSVKKFRCFFRASDGEDTVRNNFVVGDQIYCHVTTVAGSSDNPESKGQNQKHYWRLCVGRNTEGTLTKDGEAWIDLSNNTTETISSKSYTGYQAGSDIPEAQDSMIQLGNVNDTTRQGAIIEFVSGNNAPAYQIYQGINSFSLNGKSMITMGYNSATGKAELKVHGNAYIGDPNGSAFLSYDSAKKELKIKAKVEILPNGSTIGNKTFAEYIKENQNNYDDSALQTLLANKYLGLLTGGSISQSIGDAQDAADKAQGAADDAQKTADDANTAAGKAQTSADNAQKSANTANQGAKDAASAAKKADDKAAAAQKKADEAYNKAATFNYLSQALSSSTEIDGGLILSTLIALRDKSGAIWSGINGAYNEDDETVEGGALGHGIAAWYGGRMIDHEATPTLADYAKILFRHDGSGYLAGGNISWNKLGKVTIKDIYTDVSGSEKKLGTMLNDLMTFNNAFHFRLNGNNVLGIVPQVTFDNLSIGGNAVATQKWVNDTFVTKAFFDNIFRLYNGYGSSASKIAVNGSLPSDTSKLNIEAVFSFWTKKAIASLGQGDDGSTTYSALAQLNDVKVSSPAVDQVLAFNGTHWYNKTLELGSLTLAGLSDVAISNPAANQMLAYDATNKKWVNIAVPATGVTSVGLTMPTGFSVASSPITAKGTLAVTFASGYSLPTTAKQANWDKAYGWGNHASAGYVKSVKIGTTSYSPASGVITLPAYPTDYYSNATSRTANYVLAAPDGKDGVATFRALVAADIPTLTKSKISDFPTTWAWSAISGKPTTWAWSAITGKPTTWAWASITGKPTTIAGYGITDAKIVDGVITLGEDTITPLTSHQVVTDNNPTLAWGTKSKVATIGSTAIYVTMPGNPNTWRGIQNNLTSTSATDSLAAAQGKVLKGYIDTLNSYFSSGVAKSAAKLTTVSKTAWGQTFWTSGGVPTSISGNMSGVGNISMSGYIKIGSIYIGEDANGNLEIYKIDENNAHAAANLYARGGISALGETTDGSAGVGDVTWDLLESEADTRQIAISHLTTALTPYATQNWVNAHFGYTTSGKNYAVLLDTEGHAYVNVPWANTTYSAATQSAAGLLSAADKKKLDGIAAGANAYSLPLAANGTRGGVQIGYATSGRNYAVQLSGEKMYVNVPWTDTVYKLPEATATALGGVMIGYTTTGRNYAVQLDADNNAFVNVPWTDTIYTLPVATADALGGIKVGYTTSGKNYAVQLSDGKAFVNVPWSNTWTAWKGATDKAAGTAGYMPAPTIAQRTQFLRGDGTWVSLNNYSLPTASASVLGGVKVGTTLAIASGVLNLLSGVATPGTYRSVTVDTYGRVTAGTNPTTLAGYGITDAKIANGVITLGGNTITPLTSHQSLAAYTKTANYKGLRFLLGESVIGSYSPTSALDLLFAAGSNISLTIDDTTHTLTIANTYSYTHPTGGANTTIEAANGRVLSAIAVNSLGHVTSVSYKALAAADIPNLSATYAAVGRVSTLEGYFTSGVAKKAVQLNTARTLWGQSFNGTGNVSGNMTGVGNITMATANGTYIQLGDIRIVYDSENNALKVVKSDGTTAANLYATGGISSLGETADGAAGVGDVTWDLLASDTDTRQVAHSHLTTALSTYATQAWVSENFNKFNLPIATANVLGGVKIGYTTSGKNYAVQLDSSNKMFVNVPWANTTYSAATQSAAGLMSAADKKKLDGIAAGANNYTYSLPTATASALGGIKIGFTASGKNYAVVLDTDGNAYVNVPWSDTNTTYSVFSATVNGLVPMASDTNKTTAETAVGNYYLCADGKFRQLPANAFKNDNTTYSFVNKGATLAWGATAIIATVGGVDIKVTMPGNPNTNTWKAASTTQEGYVPKLALATTNTIAAQATEYVLTYIAGKETTPVWRKLPANAFLNSTYSLAGLMGSAAKGGATQPIYWNGTAFANTTYTLGKSVPSDAVFTDTTYPKAIKNITRSGTTFTATCYDGTTFTFTQQDNNTWRGMQNNLTTSASNTSDSLSAYQGYLLANGSARDNTKLPLAGGTLTGLLTANAGVAIASSKTLKIGDIYIGYDAEANAIEIYKLDGTTHVAANLYARGGVASLGEITDGSAGVGDVTWDLLANDSDSRQVALSHLTTALSTYATLDWVNNHFGYTASGKNYAVQLDTNGKMFVNVPWTDNNTTYSAATQSANGLMSAADKKKLDGIAAGANKYTYTLPTATADVLGGIKIGYTNSGKNYAVALDANGKAYVNVPWSDTNTTYSVFSATANGLVPMASDANKTTAETAVGNYYLCADGKYRPLPANAFKNDNTTYTFTNKGATLAWGTTSTIATVGGVDIKVTMPGNPNTNTWKAASTTQEGYVPKLALATTNTIAAQTTEYVLTYIAGKETTPVWRKLPANAFNNTTYSFVNKGATLSWGATATIATVGGVDIKVTMPANPNTDHYAWSDITGKPSTFAPSTHSHNYVVGSYTGSGGQQKPNYFGTNKVGFLMMNTSVNGNTHYKDWVIMDCYSGTDVGGSVAIGVNRQALGAYIMRSAAERTAWAESAELLGTHNYASYAAKKTEAIKSISRSGTTFTATRCDGTTFTFTQQDNNTTYSFSDKNVTLAWGTKSTIATVGGTDIHITMPANPNTNTWRGIQNNLTSDSTTDSLSAAQGKALANGSARDNTKLPLAGGTLTGLLTANAGIAIASSKTLKIGDIYLGYDSTNKAIEIYKLDGTTHIAANLYTRGGITALGETTDGSASAGTGDVTWDLLESDTDKRQIGHSHLTTALSAYAQKSEAIKSITRSGTTFTATRTDGTTFTFTQQDSNTTYSFTDKNVTLAWGTKSTIATVGGTDIHITMPANPNTDHYAWSDITGKPDSRRFVSILGNVSGENVNMKTTTYDKSSYFSLGLIHTPNFKGQSGYPQYQYGTMLEFCDGFFPFRIASYQTGDLYYQTAGYIGESSTYNYSGSYGGTDWLRIITSKDVVNLNASLSWGATNIIATIGGKDIKVTMPAKPAGGSGVSSDADTVDGVHADGFMRAFRGDNMSVNKAGYWACMTTNTGITSDYMHVISMDWSGNDTDHWISQLAIPTGNRRGMYYRSDDHGTNITNTPWVRLIDSSGGTLTGTLSIATGYGINDATGNGMLCYHPASWTGVTSSQWGVGAIDSQGIIRSSNSDLLHYKGNDWFTILDTSNGIHKHNMVSSNGNIPTWGTLTAGNGYSAGAIWNFPGGSDLAFAYKSGQVSMQVDGYFYQNEGNYRVCDVSGFTMNTGARISFGNTGTLIIGNSNNGGWLMLQDVCSMNGTAETYWSIRTNGNAVFQNVTSNGSLSALSDKRHKRILSKVELTVERLAAMPTIRYKWCDGRADKSIYAGSIAQDWQTVLPEVVKKADDVEGTLSLDYGVAALVAAISTARKVVDHERRIKELERENLELRQQLNKLIKG